uniref:lysozyme n=1 Tax=Timema monikensis TaxID=170555 RepID=A0A7R9HQM0_9NEOP|nr:unnamed protein product [Timema monikensis]
MTAGKSYHRLGPFLLLLLGVQGRIYDHCELARELRDRHEVPINQIPTWVCIARHESGYNTSAVNHYSGDHGLFQISQLFWCSPPGQGWACGVTCAELEDDDIEDDVVCARRIFRQHQRMSGNGFTAWSVYRSRCTGVNLGEYIEGCFDGTKNKSSTPEIKRTNELVKRRFDRSFYRHNIFLKNLLQ